MLDIIPLSALHDNYIWMLCEKQGQYCAIVDPGDASVVIAALKMHRLILSDILITHHHWDHTNGVEELARAYPGINVWGSPGTHQHLGLINRIVHEGDTVSLTRLKRHFKVMETPGHTLDHICYDTKDTLFCGDTLFTGGCGRLFEGSAEQMLRSLDRLAALPDTTQVYCGHEYTAQNLAFAERIEPHNPHLIQRIAQVQAIRAQSKPSVPANLKTEKVTNPFLRCGEQSVAEGLSKLKGELLNDAPLDRLKVFTKLRAEKD